MSFRYKEIVPWGRSYLEYIKMFNLSAEDLNRRILGVGDGPASFNAVMNENHNPVISVDPIYRLSAKIIKERIKETFNDVISQTKNNLHKFNWNYIKNPEHLGTTRMNAMDVFLNDFQNGLTQKRYIPGELPRLPFENDSFDLVISAHLLFFYSDNVDTQFHVKSILEMLRIAPEIRIFPIVDVNGNESEHLNPVQKEIEKRNAIFKKVRTNYEFQKNAHTMLVISRQFP